LHSSTTGARVRLIATLAALLACAASYAQQPDYDRALRESQAAIGRPVDDFVFRDAQLRLVRFSDLRGKPVVVSFIYTGCFQACPVTTQFLAQAVKRARDALGAESFRVVTVGFNQPFDGPEAMADFARKNRIADPQWLFLSPEPRAVEALTRAFGFSYAPTPKGFDHITQATIVDANGIIYRQIYGETFELPMLVGPLKALLSGEAERVVTLENIWTKVKLYCTVYDPVGGGYRLNYSLFVEIFAGLTFLGGLVVFGMKEYRRARRPGGLNPQGGALPASERVNSVLAAGRAQGLAEKDPASLEPTAHATALPRQWCAARAAGLRPPLTRHGRRDTSQHRR
jgi:protein SCO1/2